MIIAVACIQFAEHVARTRTVACTWHADRTVRFARRTGTADVSVATLDRTAMIVITGGRLIRHDAALRRRAVLERTALLACRRRRWRRSHSRARYSARLFAPALRVEREFFFEAARVAAIRVLCPLAATVCFECIGLAAVLAVVHLATATKR